MLDEVHRLPAVQGYFINGRVQSPTVAADAGAIMELMEKPRRERHPISDELAEWHRRWAPTLGRGRPGRYSSDPEFPRSQRLGH